MYTSYATRLPGFVWTSVFGEMAGNGSCSENDFADTRTERGNKVSSKFRLDKNLYSHLTVHVYRTMFASSTP